MGTVKDFMTTVNHFATAYLDGTKPEQMTRRYGRSNVPILLQGNKPINEFKAGNFFDSLRFALDQRFYKTRQGKGGLLEYEDNDELLTKVGAKRVIERNKQQTDGTTKKEAKNQWNIGDKERLQSLMYDRDGNFAYARMATAGVVSGALGLHFLSDFTTMRHAVGVPYI